MNGKAVFPFARPLAAGARLLLVGLLALGAVAPAVAPAQARIQTPPVGCHDGQLGGQLIQICFPQHWNGILLIYAHGYTPVQAPLELPTDELTIDGTYMPDVLMAAGFAFATSSYSRNGYAVEAAEADINALRAHFAAQVPPGTLRKVLIGGASEGGLVTTMLVEKYPSLYRGGLAMCGPLAGGQYGAGIMGDFKVVFDYFFPDVFDFGVANVPPDAWQHWDEYAPAIAAAVNADPSAREQLFRVTRAPRDPADLAGTSVTTAQALLWYHVWGTNDLIATAGGVPFENRYTWYWGSNNDWALNQAVERVAANPDALAYMRAYYEPTGRLDNPLVTLHTTLDPVVPFRHELIYLTRTILAGRLYNLTVLPVFRYGHCNFTLTEALGALGWLLLRTGEPVPGDWAEAMEAVPAASPEELKQLDATSPAP